MGCFHLGFLSLTFFSLPYSHVYCISLVLIFADKWWLSCCVPPPPQTPPPAPPLPPSRLPPISSLWTVHQSKDLPYKWAPSGSTTLVCHLGQAQIQQMFSVCMGHTHTHWDVCCQHDPVPQPPFSIFQLFCHFSSSNLSGDLLSPLCLPQERGPASETSTQITDVGWCVLTLSFITELSDIFWPTLACAS